jgi:poly-gamma-glutamate synthesis protein (capsule biosynthesis protein)
MKPWYHTAFVLPLLFLVSCVRAPVQYSCSINVLPTTITGQIGFLGHAIHDFVDENAISLGMIRSGKADAGVHIAAAIEIGFSAHEQETENRNIVIWKTLLVPIVGFVSAAPDVKLKDCSDGKVLLALPDAIPEGYMAVRVDGRALDDPLYALGARVTLELSGTGRFARAYAAKLTEALQRAAKESPEVPRLRWLAVAGDMMLGRGAAELLADEGAASLMGGAAAILAKSDAAVVNLEGVVTTQGSRARKAYTFRFDPSVAPLLAKAGIDAVLVSNNHALDWGMEGFTDMLKVLERSGIGALGGGLDRDAAAAAYEAQGFRLYGISSYPVEISGWDGRKFAAGPGKAGIMRVEDAGAAKLAEGFRDGVVDAVFVHGGTEWSTAPDMATRELFHALVDAGADAVFGSHPHVVQAVELYKGKPIFWSLGNFVFQGMHGTPGGQKGLLGLVGFLGERAVYIRSIPLLLDGERVDIAP